MEWIAPRVDQRPNAVHWGKWWDQQQRQCKRELQCWIEHRIEIVESQKEEEHRKCLEDDDTCLDMVKSALGLFSEELNLTSHDI